MVLSHIRGNELNSPTFGSFPIWFGVTGLNIFFLLFAWILFFLTVAFGPYIYGFVRISDFFHSSIRTNYKTSIIYYNLCSPPDIVRARADGSRLPVLHDRRGHLLRGAHCGRPIGRLRRVLPALRRLDAPEPHGSYPRPAALHTCARGVLLFPVSYPLYLVWAFTFIPLS